jgi:hypothetical protein
LINRHSRGTGQQRRRTPAAVDAYIDLKRLHCSPRRIEFEEERLITLTRYFGELPLTAITAKAIAAYQRTRHHKGSANRTINMDVGYRRASSNRADDGARSRSMCGTCPSVRVRLAGR